ncbi:Response regulator receiver domain-containing protein [Stigmatella aurantiaca]|uniref:Response regulator receiver domain-containing protein n=1 Tax=Stigmatella aurantiaca TaxID=41 RepID=A0A1H7Y3D8_STIAU|nr:response regulator [Stigmatella aurantiaca]SEM39848.1 Response regulator receiver domain-containing protein [Stigmatella aurantiaca]
MPVHRLLVVEDDPSWQKSLEDVARAEGCDVTVVSDGEAALSTLSGDPRTRPNLVVLDLLLPRMDGWEVYGRMRVDHDLRTIPVLMLSAAAAQEPKLGGIVGMLQKTSSPEPVIHQFRERLRGFTVPSPAAPEESLYTVRLTEDTSLLLHSLPPALRHALRLHLFRAADLLRTGLPMMSTWLMALPGEPPSLLVTVEGVRAVMEINEAERTLTVTSLIIPTYLPRM